MAVNWGNVGNILGNLTKTLSAAGVSATNMPDILQQIGLLSNPNEKEELSVCAQILVFAGQPQMVAVLANKLASETGIPAAAAALAIGLVQPGVDVPARVLQIEELIKQGG
jgi:hypothetical protein